MTITETENKFLNSLVLDSITYRLTTIESLTYIASRFRRISERCYKQRKARVLSDESTQVWLNYFTRIGFVKHHKEQIEAIEKIQEDSLRQFSIESRKIQTERDEDRLAILKQDIRDNVKLLSELGMGTPIMASIKRRIDEARIAKLNLE